MPADETRRPAGRRVLLIEDEPDLERIYADFFRQQGWTVDATNDIAEALRLTADNKPDAVLLDIIIPKPDNTVAEQGWEYLAAVKKTPPEENAGHRLHQSGHSGGPGKIRAAGRGRLHLQAGQHAARGSRGPGKSHPIRPVRP